MSNKSNNVECSVICWGIAALVGLVSMILLYSLVDYSVFMSLLIGILIGLLLGFALKLFVCRGFEDQNAATGQNTTPAETSANRAAGTAATASGSSTSVGAAGASAPEAAGTAEPAPAMSEPETPAATKTAASAAPTASTAAAASTPSSLMGTGLKPSTPLAGEAELASRKGAWKYEAPAAEKAPAKKAPAKKTAAPKPTAEKAPAAEKPAVAAAVSDGPITEGAPELYTAAPASGADDLQQISGVGPKLEQTLNDMGIYMFNQVAVWGAKEIAWVDSRLRFKGRIERDDWMSQAKNLAAGGAPQAPKKKT